MLIVAIGIAIIAWLLPRLPVVPAESRQESHPDA
jgi:hypothetical protein